MSFLFRRIGGLIVFLIAKAIGARVTSWRRDAKHNAAVGGSPTSLHLVGGAVDVGRELGGWRRSVLDVVADVQFHEKGTAAHFHLVPRDRTVLAGLAALVYLASRVVR